MHPYLSGKYNLIGQATFLLFVIFGRTYFGGGEKYQANLIEKHLDFNKHTPFTHLHLERWLLHWNATLTENFKGEAETQISERAGHIGRLIPFKISQL